MNRHSFRYLYLSFISLILLTSCAVERVQGISRLSNEQFANKMAKENYVVLDVRTPAEYDSAHLPGAIHLNVLDSTGFMQGIQLLPADKKYLVYCRSGKRSMTAARILKKEGFSNVFDLKTGMNGWTGSTESNTPK